MSELTEQPEAEEAVVSQNNDIPKPEPKAHARRSKLGLFFGVMTFLLIMALAGAGFYFFNQLRAKQEGLGGEVKTQLSRQINDYQAQLTAIQSQIATLQSEIAGKEEHFNKTLADFSELHDQKLDAARKELSDKVLQVQRQLGKTRGDWLIADAEYLLSVANERLHLVGDINTSREALEAADQRLRESGDAGVIKIREQIAKEISDIKNVKTPDIVGIYATLQALANDAQKLSLLLPYSGKPMTSAEEARNSSPVSEDSNELLITVIHELEGIVTIKRSDQPINEVLTAEQADFIKEQLKVKLELVKIALVQENDTLYQATLNDVKEWAEKHFGKNDVLNRFITEIANLQTIKLRTQLPDVSLSLKLLRDVTKLRVETDKVLESSNETPSEIKETNTPSVVAPAQPANADEPLDSTKLPTTLKPKQP